MLEIRPALPEEHAALGEITASAYLSDGLVSDDYGDRLRDVADRAAHATVLAALHDGVLVGSATVATRGGPYAEGQPDGTAVLRMLGTAPGARGTGVGEALVRAAADAARADSCHRLRLSTQHGMAAARRLYERLGFQRTPDDDWWPLPDLELLTYVLDLAYCGQCGEPGVHEACQRRLELDPPRYCTRCRRRMVVQVHPTGWSARCVEHGTITA